MKYYIVNKEGNAEEIELSVLGYSINEGAISPDTLVCTDEDNTWIPFHEMFHEMNTHEDSSEDNSEYNSEDNERNPVSPKGMSSVAVHVALIVIVVVFFVCFALFSGAHSPYKFNPAYLLCLIPFVFFCLFVWLMFSFRSLLAEIRDLLKKGK